MSISDLGRVIPLWRGTYSPATAYELNDIVQYGTDGSIYWHSAVAETKGIAPTVQSAWVKLLDAGAIPALAAAAEAAKTAAQSARAAAQTAQNGAETARTGAESAATAAAQSATAAQTAQEAAAASAAAVLNGCGLSIVDGKLCMTFEEE